MMFKIDLQSLISSANELRWISLDQLVPGPWQARKKFTDQEELCESIKAYGILEPLLVRAATQNKFHIIAGERRWRAACAIDLKCAPCRLMSVTDQDAMLINLTENVQRNSLCALDEARGYQAMIDKGYTQERVAQLVGKSRPHVANSVRLLKLPDAVQAMLQDGSLNAGQARALIGKQNCEDVAVIAAHDKTKVRDLETKQKSADVSFIEEQLSSSLKLGVKLQTSGSKGAIKISYENLEQLDRIVELLISLKV